jgi:hypothetical protein
MDIYTHKSKYIDTDIKTAYRSQFLIQGRKRFKKCKSVKITKSLFSPSQYSGPKRGEMEPGPATNMGPHPTPKAI